MPLFETLQCLLLAWTCLSAYGTPVPLPGHNPGMGHSCYGECMSPMTTRNTGAKSEPSGTEHVTGLVWEAGAGGAAGPHGQPEGTAPVTQTENGGSLDGRSGPSEVKKVGSTSEMEDTQRRSEAASMLPVYPDTTVSGEAILSLTGGRKMMDGSLGTSRLPSDGLASFTALPQMRIAAGERKDQGQEDQTKILGYHASQWAKESSLPSSTTNPRDRTQKQTSHSPVPPLVFVSLQTSTPLTVWGHDGATISSVPDPLLPEIGPNLMPREDGPESLWTEAMRPSGGKLKQIRKASLMLMENVQACILLQ